MMAAILAFMVFASSCAVIAALERILGRPIPQLRFSRRVRRNRIFAAVPICMFAVFVLLFVALLRARVCSHCVRPYAWQSLGPILQSFVFSASFSGAIGWIIFGVLSVASLRFSRRLAGLDGRARSERPTG